MGRRGQGILASASLATVKITRTSRALRSSCFAKAELLHPLSVASPRASPKRFVQNNFSLLGAFESGPTRLQHGRGGDPRGRRALVAGGAGISGRAAGSGPNGAFLGGARGRNLAPRARPPDGRHRRGNQLCSGFVGRTVAPRRRSTLLAVYVVSLAAKTKLATGGFLPLHLAARHGMAAEVLTMLLTAHPDGAEAPDDFGRLPLHHAVSTIKHRPSEAGDVLDLVSVLIAAHPPACATRDGYGQLPLAWAIEKQSPPGVVEALLVAYPETAGVPTRSGLLPLHLAAHR